MTLAVVNDQVRAFRFAAGCERDDCPVRRADALPPAIVGSLPQRPSLSPCSIMPPIMDEGMSPSGYP